MKSFLSMCICLLATSLCIAVDLKVPTKVEGNAGEFLKIMAQTTGKEVKWRTIDSGITLFPMELLKDTKTAIVLASKPGTYRIVAVTCQGDEVSNIELITVVIAGDSPPTPPPQPPPPAEPDTSFVKELRSSFLADGGNKEALAALEALYREAARDDFLSLATTWKHLHDSMAKASRSLGIAGKLSNTQNVIAKYLKEMGLPSAGSTLALDSTKRKLAKESFLLVANSLRKLK